MNGGALWLAAQRAAGLYRHASVRRMLCYSIAISAVFLFLFIAGVVLLFAETQWFSTRWVEVTSDFFGTVLGSVVAWFLFPILLPLIAGLFMERAAERIETESYGEVPTAAPEGTFSSLGHDVRFAFWALFLNLAMLPVYLIPVVNLCAYYGVNGYLLGREFFVMAASRRLGRKGAGLLRQNHAARVFTGGVIIALAANIPFVNLIAPFFGIALMVHLAHALMPKDAITPWLEAPPEV